MEKTNAMRLLDRAGIPYEALSYPHADEAVDARTVARMLGEPPERVYKTLVLMGADGQPAVCVIPGPGELDLKLAAEAFRVKSLRMLRVEELKPLTGYVRGGCSPIGMKKPYRTALDDSALALAYLFVSGGRVGAQVRIAPGDLIRACGAMPASLIRLTM